MRQIRREKRGLELRRWRWGDKDLNLRDKAGEAGVFPVGKGQSQVARSCAETEQPLRMDEQTGRTQEVFRVRVGSLLWTHLSDSAFRAGRPQREQDGRQAAGAAQ